MALVCCGPLDLVCLTLKRICISVLFSLASQAFRAFSISKVSSWRRYPQRSPSPSRALVYPLLFLAVPCQNQSFSHETPSLTTVLLSPSSKTEDVSSLVVSVPAWVEFLHRETRRGQLAFLVAVRATAPPPSPRTASPAAVAASSPSAPTGTTATKPSLASVTAAVAATDATGAAAATAAAAAAGPETPVSAASDNTANTASPAKTAVAAATGGAAEGGDDSTASPARAAKPPPPPSPALPRPPAWTCVRTNRELGGAVQAYRESVGASTAATAGSWQPRPRPRVIRHMGMADQVG